MYVTICFEMRSGGECDRFFAYLQEHPKDVWSYEARVREHFHASFWVHWTDADVVATAVQRVRLSAAASLIEYRVALRAGVPDPALLVDQLRRCENVQEGVVGGHWRVHAWYKRDGEETWTADAGNDGRLRRYAVRVRALLGRVRALLQEPGGACLY
jgi:hypothetical protein